jgi:hypothetical protein
MLFSIEWQIREGAAGGTLTSGGTRNSDGTFAVTYTAPTAGAGPFHVTATIREYPSAIGVATIVVAPRS